MVEKMALAIFAASVATGAAYGAILPADQLDVQGSVTVVDAATLSVEAGQAIDDTFTGTATIDVTISWDDINGSDAASSFGGLSLYNGGAESIGVGNAWPETTWHVFRNGNVGGPGGFLELDNGGGPLAIAVGDAQTFQLVINYVAGGDDSATVIWNGNANPLTDADYSFDEVQVRAGNDLVQADFADVSIQVVPEPASLALLGLGGLLVARRRRE